MEHRSRRSPRALSFSPSRTSTPIRSSRRASSRRPARSASASKLFADWRFDADGAAEAGLRAQPAGGRRRARCWSRATTSAAARRASTRRGRSYDYGFRAVVSTSIADIFKNNSLKNGLLPIVVDAATHAKLLAAPGAQVTVSVADQTLTLPDGTRATFPIDPFARYCLLNGVDELEFLLSQEAAIAAFEAKRVAMTRPAC